MKNKMTDLNNHLFEMAERLLDNDLTDTDEKLANEVRKADALVKIAGQLVQNGRLQLDVLKLQGDYEKRAETLPPLLECAE